jgi:hypothetical protein
MIQLLWGILNLFLVLSFFFFLIGTLIRGRKFLMGYNKLFTVPVLLLGIFGVLSSKKDEEKKIPIHKEMATVETLSAAKNLSNNISLVLVRDKETEQILQERSYSTFHGFVMGLDWDHMVVIENKDTLQIRGVLHWKFMGNLVFSQSKVFEVRKEKLN